MSIPRDYAGEPQYPEPWTTNKPREGLRDIDEARIVSLAPDVCLTPVGSSVVPIPYPVVDFCGHDKNYTPSVRFTRKKAMVMRSCTTHVHGDKPGIRKGRKSGTVESICEPIGHAYQVRAEGSHVIRHLDRFHMNSRNTQGEAIFVRDIKNYAPPKNDDPVPGSLRWRDKPVELAFANTGTMTDAGPGLLSATNTAATAPSTSKTGTANLPSDTRAPTNIVSKFPWRGLLRRFGPYGFLIEGVIQDMATPSSVREAEARAFSAIFSNAGHSTIISNRLLGGRTPANLESIRNGSAWDFSGKYGLIIQAEERIPLANDILSSVAGRSVDVRTMTDAQVNDILAPFRGLSDDEVEQKLKALAEARKQEEEQKQEPKPGPQPVPPPPLDPGARVDGEKRRQEKCLIGPYGDIDTECKASGGKTHHVVADMTYRLGDRRGKTTKERVPNSPTEDEGESICLDADAHSSKKRSSGVHDLTRLGLVGIDHPNFPGTAPIGRILTVSQAALMATNGIDKVCAAAANSRAETQVKNKTGFSAPGRTAEKPLPKGHIADVLREGRYP